MVEYESDRNGNDFKTMYGKDAEFVDVTKVSSLQNYERLILEKIKLKKMKKALTLIIIYSYI